MVDIDSITNDLKAKYPDLGIQKLDIDESKGTSTFYISPKKSLPFLGEYGAAIKPNIERASSVSRRALDRSALDLRTKNSPYDEDPKALYKRAMAYYKNDPLVGATINTLVFLSAKGFENDIDDADIKSFYDVWCYDVNFQEVLEWIFTDVFKVGHVFIYKALTAYTKRESKLSPVPGISLSNLSINGNIDTKKIAQEILDEVLLTAVSYGIKDSVLQKIAVAAAKKADKATQIPVGYTVLNPLSVDIEGSLFFNSTSVVLSAPDDLKKLLTKEKKELTEQEKALIEMLPKDFKKEIIEKGKITLDSDFVDQITYMKLPYERYASPRLARVFDSLEYKQALISADLSTLDGISNYILKITIGNDEYPVSSQSELETVAKLFDTPSKSFDVVWNHTLKIEKIVSPEIEAILGRSKYEQVEEDISGGLAVIRTLIDGKGAINSSQLGILLKGLTEEINYVRGIVTRWIYKEYQKIAEVAGFDRFPKVRWDDSILKDTILYMTVISQLVDRRMLSYKTAHETLGFDYSTELSNMQQELDLVKDGTFGLRGSPWQQPSGSGVQEKTEAPKGTPSSGRPTAKPAKQKNTPKLDDKPASSASADSVIRGLSIEDFLESGAELNAIKDSKED